MNRPPALVLGAEKPLFDTKHKREEKRLYKQFEEENFKSGEQSAASIT